MRRTIKVLTVVVLMAVMLVASISPVLARPAKFGQNLHDNPSCEATTQAQNSYGAHHLVNPDATPPVLPGCWVVLPH